MKEHTVLFVDDERHILNSLQRLVRKEDYNVLTADNGRDGLALFKKHEINMVVSDQRMPDLPGTEFLQQIREKYPDTIRVILSGYADVSVIVEAINQGGVYRFIPKPWNDDELKVTIRQCLEHYEVLKQNAVLTEQTKAQNEELKRLNAKLEEHVQFRTRSLQLSQEILEELPIGIVGISLEQEIIFTNKYARTSFLGLQQALPGEHISAVLPESLLSSVISSLNHKNSPDPITFSWDQQSIKAVITPLGKEQEQRGCILLLETLTGVTPLPEENLYGQSK